MIRGLRNGGHSKRTTSLASNTLPGGDLQNPRKFV